MFVLLQKLEVFKAIEQFLNHSCQPVWAQTESVNKIHKGEWNTVFNAMTFNEMLCEAGVFLMVLYHLHFLGLSLHMFHCDKRLDEWNHQWILFKHGKLFEHLLKSNLQENETLAKMISRKHDVSLISYMLGFGQLILYEDWAIWQLKCNYFGSLFDVSGLCLRSNNPTYKNSQFGVNYDNFDKEDEPPFKRRRTLPI